MPDPRTLERAEQGTQICRRQEGCQDPGGAPGRVSSRHGRQFRVSVFRGSVFAVGESYPQGPRVQQVERLTAEFTGAHRRALICQVGPLER